MLKSTLEIILVCLVYIRTAVFREYFPKIGFVAQAFIGFRQVNPNTYGDHRPIKSHETVPSTLLFECKQPKQF